MESPSEAPHSGGSSWKQLLITASILSCWIQPTSPVTIVPNPPHGTVGGNVTLTIQGFSEQALSYNWYRKTTQNSNNIVSYSVSSGVQRPADIREKVLPNGFLLIPNLTLSDNDDYIVQIVDSNGVIGAIAKGQLEVHEKLAKPNISVNSTNIRENDSVVLTCSTENNRVDIQWFYNDQPLSLDERMDTFKNKKTITIKNVKRGNMGSYQCKVLNPISSNTSDPLNLIVNYGPEHIKILPSPESEEIKVQFKDSLILECQTQSYPSAHYQWHFNDSFHPVHSGNTYTITYASWNHSGKYTCWAKNNVTNLSIFKNITIKVVGASTISLLVSKPCKPGGMSTRLGTRILGGGSGSSLSGGAIAGILIVVFTGVALIGVLIYLLFFRETGKSELAIAHLTGWSTLQLSIPNVSLKHSGTYTCNASNSVSGLFTTKNINLTVYENLAKPNISVKGTNIRENDSLVLTCSTKNEGLSILWFFNNKPLSLNERMNRSENNQTLTIRSVKRKDTGSYQCEVWNHIITKRSDPLKVTVNYGPDHIKILPNSESEEIKVKFNDSLTLECQALSYPPAKYEWHINDNMEFKPSGNTYKITSASWEHSGKYTCLARNSMTNLSISKDITIKVVGMSPGRGNGPSLFGGAIAAIVIGVLAGVALIGTLIYFLFFRKSGR
ncbi:carcinoembryonic antigen-related cell adhesion molecule 2-like [Dromiciops gliroides]|uniref:carcinoembryonic antigen-related cell adhesion molecule 2-like n=1 Tax=Dromiciops gliroides TaxID=33562 RepID=UPI001CC3D241|nr:carcinoembryonic antigen-related cell adhesion molecule 2-like [Dromiciops gliroides]